MPLIIVISLSNKNEKNLSNDNTYSDMSFIIIRKSLCLENNQYYGRVRLCNIQALLHQIVMHIILKTLINYIIQGPKKFSYITKHNDISLLCFSLAYITTFSTLKHKEKILHIGQTTKNGFSRHVPLRNT